MVAIDIFTKCVWAVAIKTKQTTDVVNAFQQVLDNMGIPKQMYSDRAGSFNSSDLIRLPNAHTIKHSFIHQGQTADRTVGDDLTCKNV